MRVEPKVLQAKVSAPEDEAQAPKADRPDTAAPPAPKLWGPSGTPADAVQVQRAQSAFTDGPARPLTGSQQAPPSIVRQTTGLFSAPATTATAGVPGLVGTQSGPAITEPPPPPPPLVMPKARAIPEQLAAELSTFAEAKRQYDKQRAEPPGQDVPPQAKYEADLKAFDKLTRQYEGTILPEDLSEKDKATFDALPAGDAAARQAFLNERSPKLGDRYWKEMGEAKKAGEVVMTQAPEKPRRPNAPKGVEAQPVPTPDQRIESAAKQLEAHGLATEAKEARDAFEAMKSGVAPNRPRLEKLAKEVEQKGLPPDVAAAIGKDLQAAAKRIPMVDDFLAAAKKNEVFDPMDAFKAKDDPTLGKPVPGYAFTPDRADELAFKTSYAREATNAGLTQAQVTGVYAFETGGNGTAALQPIRDGSGISTALGYAQLLAANTAGMMADHGERFAKRLDEQGLTDKAALVRRMSADVNAFTAEGEKELMRESATQDRYETVAKSLDAAAPKDAEALRAAVAKGKDDPKASWKAVDELVKQLETTGQTDAAKALKAAHAETMSKVGPKRWAKMQQFAETEKGMGMHATNLDKDIGPMMQVRKLQDTLGSVKKTLQGVYDAMKARNPNDPLLPELEARVKEPTPAQLELLNLAGAGAGGRMLRQENWDVPTANFFDRGGFERNPVVHGHTGSSLVNRIGELMVKFSTAEGVKGVPQFNEAYAAYLFSP